MPSVKISELEAQVAPVDDAAVVVINIPDGLGGFTTKKISRVEFEKSLIASNIDAAHPAPANYTPVDGSIAEHLKAIDGELAVASPGENNTTSNLGAGEGIATPKVGVDLPLKSLVGTGAIGLSSDANEITINSNAEANTTSNLGAGEGIAAPKVGVDLPMKSLTVGAGLSISSTADEIELVNTNANAGAVELIATTVIGGSTASVEFTQFDDSVYSHYIFVIEGIRHGSGNQRSLLAQMSNDGGSSYKTSLGDYKDGGFAGNEADIVGTTTAAWDVNDYMSAVIEVYGASNNGAQTAAIARWVGQDDAGSGDSKRVVTTLEINDAIRFMPDANSFTAGTFRMYGVNK